MVAKVGKPLSCPKDISLYAIDCHLLVGEFLPSAYPQVLGHKVYESALSLRSEGAADCTLRPSSVCEHVQFERVPNAHVSSWYIASAVVFVV